MHNELTRQDLKMMREELDYRRITLRPKLLEAVKEARAFGDLSENFEYKAAKQEKNRNESRIRFLENMIKTAKVFDDTSGADQVGLYDKVTVYMEDDDETEVYQIVTTMRQDVLKGLISKESPVGRSLLGKRVGDRVHIQVNENYGYDAVIRSIEKGEDSLQYTKYCRVKSPCLAKKSLAVGHISNFQTRPRPYFAAGEVFVLSGHVPDGEFLSGCPERNQRGTRGTLKMGARAHIRGPLDPIYRGCPFRMAWPFRRAKFRSAWVRFYPAPLGA